MKNHRQIKIVLFFLIYTSAMFSAFAQSYIAPINYTWGPAGFVSAQAAANDQCAMFGYAAGGATPLAGYQNWWFKFDCYAPNQSSPAAHGIVERIGLCPAGTWGVKETITVPIESEGTSSDGSVNVGPIKCGVQRNIPKCIGMCCANVGNPFDALTGNKHQAEIDVPSNKQGSIGFTRYYNSYISQTPFAGHWTHSYSYKLVKGNSLSTPISIHRPTGQILSFQQSGSIYLPDADINAKLEPITLPNGTAGWRLTGLNDAQEIYQADGSISSIAYSNGRKLSFAYSDASTPVSQAPAPGLLIKVADELARNLTISYDSSRGISSIATASGLYVNYQYNSDSMLSKAIYSDLSTKEYIYNESVNVDGSNQPVLLTGRLYENVTRDATWKYNANGLAVSSEHGNGQDKFVVARIGGSVTSFGANITQPNGQVVSIYSQDVLGIPHIYQKDQPAGSGCNAAVKTSTYDSANGNKNSEDDFNGKRVCYLHDVRNLETVRIEGLNGGTNGTVCSAVTSTNAVLPNGSRKISTQWHPDWRVQTRVAEPRKITTLVYNGQPDPTASNAVASCAPSTALLPDGKRIAVLCKRVEQATTDLDGSKGLAAPLDSAVSSRISSWTYNKEGQTLTEDGPRTDVSDVTTHAYYTGTLFTGADPNAVGRTAGDLKASTDAAGLTTQYTKYNKQGQLLESVDPNGVITSYSYDLRQRLLSSTVGGQKTSYMYDFAGQLKRITYPDSSWTGYDYDSAHRLTAVHDNLGNRIEYTLDNAGNKTEKKVKDPAAVLRRQLTRSLDALGRVQQTTGRE